jgi:hypothetical protein
MSDWAKIGTVVGSASTGSYTFILKSLQGKLGDIVATRVEVPSASGGTQTVATVWGRIVSIDRFNPFFPAEAAQELADQSIDLMDTVLSGSRDHLEAQVLILGTTLEGEEEAQLSPLTYPVKPSAPVLYPDAASVRQLLTGERTKTGGLEAKLRIGSLIGRGDVEVSLTAKQVVSRHLAILAMTGGGKTVAARRIIRELIDLKYPLLIFDPHGDYLGLFEKRALFKGSEVKIFYPVIRVWENNIGIIADLISKMGRSLTDPQQHFYNYLISEVDAGEGENAASFIQRLIDFATAIAAKKRSKDKDHVSDELAEVRGPSINAVVRSLTFVRNNLLQMERNNERLRSQPRFANYEFHGMPDPTDDPESIIRPGQVSIFYLAGYDHLNQSAIVSIVLEALFAHRLTLSNRIPPFQAVVEEAHNFIPSRREGIDETPSLQTIRKVITEGRKFGTGLVLISQRPSRLDETTLAQCNSFLVLRIVNPNDKRFVRSVMENLSEADANILQTFGPGQGIVSGQAVRFPLLVKVDFDAELVSEAIGDEDFIAEAARWAPNQAREAATKSIRAIGSGQSRRTPSSTKAPAIKPGRRGGKPSRRLKPEGF